MSLNDFDFHNKLGEGAFSKVFKVTRKADGTLYAMKQVKLLGLDEKEKENALNEIRILASFDHPNIISFKEAFLDDNMSLLCIVMQFAEEGDLLKIIESHKKSRSRIPEDLIWGILKDSASALSCLHSNQILHRDVKSANIFLAKDRTAMLGDLNVSKVVKQGMAYTQTGTPYYASPEVWKDDPYNAASDIWSLGCVIYELASLRPPFTGKDMTSLAKNVINGVFREIPGISKGLMRVIRSMLQVAPNLRPKASELFKISADKPLNNSEDKSQLLKTIKFDHKVNTLRSRLPESQYGRKYSENSNAGELPSISEVEVGKRNRSVPYGNEFELIKEQKDVHRDQGQKEVQRLPVGRALPPKVPKIVASPKGYVRKNPSPFVIQKEQAGPVIVSHSPREGSGLKRIGSLVIEDSRRVSPQPNRFERVPSVGRISPVYSPQPAWWG